MKISEINRSNGVLATFEGWTSNDFSNDFRSLFRSLADHGNNIKQVISLLDNKSQYHVRLEFAALVDSFEQEINAFENYDWRPDKSLTNDFGRNKQYLSALRSLQRQI